ncbi:MAG: hypothetical protein E7395_03705 [Ruminococcaceae bacterium]|nr:hypothetical protein [Oscillospiraceae bacterium]
MPIKSNFLERIKTVENISIPKLYSGGNGTPSVSIVYNKNGKRFTISKALATKLALEDECYAYPIIEDGAIYLVKNMVGENGIKLKLNGDDKKTCYNASFISFIVNEFHLDYSDTTSRSYSKISFENTDGVEIAAINLSQ